MSDVDEILKSGRQSEKNENISHTPEASSEGNRDISPNNEAVPETDEINQTAQDVSPADNGNSVNPEEKNTEPDNDLNISPDEKIDDKQSSPSSSDGKDNYDDLSLSDNIQAPSAITNERVERKTFFKESTKIILSRSIYYFFMAVFIFNVDFPDFFRFCAGLLLIGFCFYLNKVFKKIDKFNYIVKSYFRLTAAIFDMGATVFLMYLSGSSRNLFMLSFSALTWVYGFYGFNFSIIVIFLLNTILFYITGIMFGRSDITNLNIDLGFYSQIFVLAWIIAINLFTKWFRAQSELRYEIVKMIEKLFSKLPKSVFVQIASLMSSEEVKGLQYKFKTAIEHLQFQIIERDQEIEYLKNNMSQGGAGQDNFAVNEINSLLDIENLSLKENNKKLMELNKSLEQRVQMLVQELEIANSELERVYSSMNDSEAEAEAEAEAQAQEAEAQSAAQ